MTPYNSALRRSQAQETRARVVSAAAACFSEHGYRATTLRVIAQRAGVSVETVQATGAKRSLLVAAFNQLFTGDAAEEEFGERPAVAAILAEDDGTVVLRRLAQWIADANAKIADLWQVLVASATDDADVAGYLETLHTRTRKQTTRIIEQLHQRGLIAPDRPAARTADLIWDAQSPDHYLRLVRQARWSQRAYAEIVADDFTSICRPVSRPQSPGGTGP